MYRIKLVFRRFIKGITLRGVNVLGLSLICMCLLLSGAFVYYELSYDRFHVKAARIFRLGLETNGQSFGARVLDLGLDELIAEVPEVKQVTGLTRDNTVTLEYNGVKRTLNDIYTASPNFFGLFDFPLLYGDTATALKNPESVVISRKMAASLFAEQEAIGKRIRLSGRKFPKQELTVTGVFEDMPANSHFHTDILASKREEAVGLSYVYLLLEEGASAEIVEKKIIDAEIKAWEGEKVDIKVSLTPLTDIHLRSHQSGEMEANGDMKYIYLLLSSNLLLLVIVLFNLWLNSNVLFLNNSKYYQLLKLNGASVWTVLADEIGLTSLLVIISVSCGLFGAYYLSEFFELSLKTFLVTRWFGLLLVLFVLLILFIAVLPIVLKFASQLFSSVQLSQVPRRMGFSKMKYMLVMQYAIVMIVLVLMVGVSQQIALIQKSQPAGDEQTILVTDEQPEEVTQRFELLKTELLKYPEFIDVTASMTLPGGTLKDAILVSRLGSNEEKIISLMVVDKDFPVFFKLKSIAGERVLEYPNTWKEEEKKMNAYIESRQMAEGDKESYIINESAVKLLGFATPDEAVGKPLRLYDKVDMSFIPYGTIAGVVEDFRYANLQEEVTPLLLICRKKNLYCFMVRIDESAGVRGITLFNEAWKKINPDYPADYTMLHDVYGRVYRNEWGAERLLSCFSILCLFIANIGLLIFMAFVIKKRTKEVGVRKINGAGVFSVLRMLSGEFIGWIGLAFLVAVPISYYILWSWLKEFNCKITISWWFFAVAGICTLFFSLLSVGWLTWKAAAANPVEALKSE